MTACGSCCGCCGWCRWATTASHRPLGWAWADFEDALQAACAVHVGAEVLITRNAADYSAAPLAIETPEQFLTRPQFLEAPREDASEGPEAR